ncbi:NAD-dependent epimerase/dehydratase family protein [Halosquirtibacter xylanolyticus]|uniref:NAD-dependent epimerase/dehydratase family protein n=1 Tax=Halosquirtibacter xylanolyticus TaxID=3374599 RepID=UPI00374A1F78|nr:NAD-dependent epimerase/dehydratase family protein [Prolixibacteraceae bacterium]
MRKILVTGAAGFIGFHLVEKFCQEDNVQVYGIDNINDYYDVRLKYARLKESGFVEDNVSEYGLEVISNKYDHYRFQRLDITDLSNLEALFRKEQFTHVVNLAAQAGVRYSIENPHAYVQSNLVGFVNILECCRHNKIKHLLYASSSSVYGGNKKVPFSEEDRVDRPVSLYAATKKSNELMAHTYSHLYNLKTTGLRFFTVYGPWGRPDMAPMLFAKAIMNGEPIKVFNNGNMERDFTYIDDIIEGVFSLIMKEVNIVEEYSIFNIGNSSPVKLMDFIETLEKELGLDSKKVFLPMQDGDVEKTFANVQDLNTVVSYVPKIDLVVGVEKFIEWYKIITYI